MRINSIFRSRQSSDRNLKKKKLVDTVYFAFNDFTQFYMFLLYKLIYSFIHRCTVMYQNYFYSFYQRYTIK